MDKKLNEIFRSTLYLDEKTKIDDNMYVGDIVEWDSLSHMNLIYNISNEYEIKIEFSELKNIKNWKELKKLVIDKVQNK